MSPIRWKPNPTFGSQVQAAAFKATQDTFLLDIVPEAKRRSPVTPQGLEYNLEKGKKGLEAKGTGTNRRSIDAEVQLTEKGPFATFFTQSGYGGYLEVGTAFMRAQPYMYPAYVKFIKQIGPRMKALIGRRSQ